MTVLVIACPHALGLAIPLVVAISTTLGARSGLLVRDRRGLEEARNVRAVFFDKTGTLTRGEFRVAEITTVGTLTQDDALALAAAVEHDSEHTIAQGIVKSAERPVLLRESKVQLDPKLQYAIERAASWCSTTSSQLPATRATVDETKAARSCRLSRALSWPQAPGCSSR